jgi:hypothetical protein
MPTKREERPTPEQPNIVQAIHHWSDSKLEFELTFAEAGVVETWPETIAWRDALRAEVARRAQRAESPRAA